MSLPEPVPLESGAEARLWNPGGAAAVVCLNGGRRAHLEGTWSASVEWLVRRLAPRLPQLTFVEVRYRVRSWELLGMCVEDARAAVAATGADRLLLLGFSMGGAVAAAAAREPGVEAVLGLAPWLHDRLDLSPLTGRRLDVLHGSLDRSLPGIPGVSPDLSRRGFERARALGARGGYRLIRGGVHGVAVRASWGTIVPLPRANTWLRLVRARLDDFQSG